MKQACALGRPAAAAAVIALLGLAPRAVAQEARGVNPADNLTKVELLPKLTVIDAGGHVGGNWPRQDWTVSGGIRFISL
jgi:hypothetical protein